MPSTMIHLMVAREVEPHADALFWVGNFAPDCIVEREQKDPIHLRDQPDRWAALERLREALNKSDPLARGWLLHLFADSCWEETQLKLYQAWHAAAHPGESWFLPYRAEISRVTFHLYHALAWGREIMDEIAQADLENWRGKLPVAIAPIDLYRRRVVERHTKSDPEEEPLFYKRDALDDFARETADKYLRWI